MVSLFLARGDGCCVRREVQEFMGAVIGNIKASYRALAGFASTMREKNRRGYSPGIGIRPICCIRLIASVRPQNSAILPSAMLMMPISTKEICLPLPATPMKSPVWVISNLERKATLSPSATMSSSKRLASEKVAEKVAALCCEAFKSIDGDPGT